MSDTNNKQAYAGFQSFTDTTSEYNALVFIIRREIAKIRTSIPCVVVSVTNNGGVSPVGQVNVQPMVNQIDGYGNPTPLGVLYNLPYFRLAGGNNAIIMDPQIGDIGFAHFAQRDISVVKRTKTQSNPGSRRTHDWADGFFTGVYLGASTPTQYIQFHSDGVKIVSPTRIDLVAPIISLDGELEQGLGAVHGDQPAHIKGPVTVDLDLTAEGKSVAHHTHAQHNDSHNDTEAETDPPS